MFVLHFIFLLPFKKGLKSFVLFIRQFCLLVTFSSAPHNTIYFLFHSNLVQQVTIDVILFWKKVIMICPCSLCKWNQQKMLYLFDLTKLVLFKFYSYICIYIFSSVVFELMTPFGVCLNENWTSLIHKTVCEVNTALSYLYISETFLISPLHTSRQLSPLIVKI